MEDQIPTQLSELSRAAITQLCMRNANASSDLRLAFKDAEGRFLCVSGGWLEAYAPRSSLDDVVGVTNEEFFPASHAGAALLEDRRVLETGGALAPKIEHETFPGRPDAWVQITRQPLRDGGGATVGTWSLIRDISAQVKAEQALAASREQLEASERMHRAVFQQNPQPMWLFDSSSFEIFEVNKAAIAVYGYSREEFLAMTVMDLLPAQADIDSFQNSMTAGELEKSGYRVNVPRRHRYKDGTIADVEVTANDVTLDGRACRIVLSQDVTLRNRAVNGLAAARDEALEASKAKTLFLANMSHEIRTPMNGVVGLTELLLDTGLDDDQRALAEQVASSGEQMVVLINDILDISKIEAGQLDVDMTIFALHETVEQACAVAAIQARLKGLQLDVLIDDDVPEQSLGDGRRLRQILLNLVANAVKFTSEGTITVHVGTRPTAGGGRLARIEVRDSGIGIEPEILDHMFERFTQADASTTRTYGGSGLGLAIARELIGLMGGVIGADSTPGSGSTFWVELPLPDQAASEPLAQRASGPLWSTPPLILVAEDSPVNQAVAVGTLEHFGCQVEVVSDGRQALEMLARRGYDAVLMDCEMLDIDGYAATTELRRREQGARHTPVIAMTANSLGGDRERCLAAGMDDYLSKPLHRDTLLAALLRWIPAGGDELHSDAA